MSQRFLKYETEMENPNVDEHGVLKASSGGKKSFLLFENVTFSQTNKSKTIRDLGCSELINSLDVTDEEEGRTYLLDKYRMIFSIKTSTYGTYAILQSHQHADRDSAYAIYTPFITEEGYTLTLNGMVSYCAAYDSDGGYISFKGLTKEVTVTCYLEEL